MQRLIQSVPMAPPHARVRLVLDSFDSGEECSILHWLETRQLVDEEDVLIKVTEEELEVGPQI